MVSFKSLVTLLAASTLPAAIAQPAGPVQTVIDSIDQAANAVISTTDQLTDLAAGTLLGGVLTATTAIALVNARLATVVAAVGALPDVTDLVAVEDIVDAVVNLQGVLDAFLDTIEINLGPLTDIPGVGTLLEFALTTTRGRLDTILGTLTDVLQGAAPQLDEILAGLTGTITDLLDQLSGLLSKREVQSISRVMRGIPDIAAPQVAAVA